MLTAFQASTGGASPSGAPRRFRPTSDPKALARAAQLGAAAGSRLTDVQVGRQLWTPPSAVQFQAPRKDLQRLVLPGDGTGSIMLGGQRIPTPNDRLVVDYDPQSGALLDRGGQALMLGLTPTDVHDPTELSTYLAGYKNAEFLHEKACPIIPTDFQEDKYRTFDQGIAFLRVEVKSNDDAAPAELRMPSALTQYKTQTRRIAVFIPDVVSKQVTNPGYNLRYTAMGRCRRAIDMDLEFDTLGPSGLLTSTGNFNSNNVITLTSGYQWADTSGNVSNCGTSSDPIEDMTALINVSAQQITGWFVNHRAALAFLKHPKVKDYMRQMLGDGAAMEMLKLVSSADQVGAPADFYIPMIGPVHVAKSRAATNATSTTTDYIMPNVVVALVQPPGVPTDGEQICNAYNFRYRGLAGTGFYTREVRFDARGSGGTLIIVEESSIPTMTSTIIGGIISGVLQ